MLVITRNMGEELRIRVNGVLVTVVLLRAERSKARLGICAPPEVEIIRAEVEERLAAEAETVQVRIAE